MSKDSDYARTCNIESGCNAYMYTSAVHYQLLTGKLLHFLEQTYRKTFTFLQLTNQPTKLLLITMDWPKSLFAKLQSLDMGVFIGDSITQHQNLQSCLVSMTKQD